MPLDLATLGAFTLAAIAVVVSPGPDTMLILRNALASGSRVGLATVAGVQLGLVAHTVAAVAGLSLVIRSSPLVFQAVALAGAAYLGWLGVQSFRAGAIAMQGGGAPVGAWKGLRDAMLTNILNPKVIVLFLALMPGFVDVRRGEVPAQLAVLAATLIGVNVVWQTSLALGAAAARRWLASAPVQRAISRATGAVLLVFAVLMAVQHGLGD